MATQLFANNATGYLNASINSSATSIVLQSGQGALFPTITGSDWFMVTLFDGASTVEVVKCTARSSDTLTVTRAQEGTTASAFAAGVVVELRATKGTFEGLVQRDAPETLTNKTLVTPALGTPASGVVTNLTGTASININGTVGATTANSVNATTLTTSGDVTHNGGTAGGVAYLNSSKVLTSGSALTFDGTNFGIGTSSLAGLKLVVKGANGGPATSGITQTGVLRLTGGTGLYNVLDMGVNESTDTAWIQATRANSLDIYDALTINPLGGNVGIGTTSPSYQLHLSADSAAKPTTSTWTVSSDARIKTDVVDAELARCYEIIKTLPLKHYKWDAGLYSENVTQDKAQLGWIAQDVERVFPKAVHVNKLDYMQKVENGSEEYEEQDFTVETVAVEKTEIKIINGAPVRVITTEQEEKKTMLFDEVEVKDEAGNIVMDGDRPLMHQMPRMVKKTRPVMVPVKTIDDCKAIDADQIIKALYGAVQLLMAKVEALETK